MYSFRMDHQPSRRIWITANLPTTYAAATQRIPRKKLYFIAAPRVRYEEIVLLFASIDEVITVFTWSKNNILCSH